MNKKKLITGLALASLAAGVTLYLRGVDVFPMRPVPSFRALGPAKAPVKVVEFSDFSCPSCAAAWNSLEETAQKYPEYLKIEFRHYPLTTVHPWSFDAAVYADCAGRQGRFREYAGFLFAGQAEWASSEGAKEILAAYARKAGLEKSALDACLAGPETAEAVRADMADGDRRNIASTPTFFVNGKRFVGPKQLMRQLEYLAISIKPDKL